MNKKKIEFWLILSFALGLSSFGFAYTSMEISMKGLGKNPNMIIGFVNALSIFTFMLFFYTSLDLLIEKKKFEKEGKDLGLNVIKCEQCNKYFYTLEFETTKLCCNCISKRMRENMIKNDGED